MDNPCPDPSSSAKNNAKATQNLLRLIKLNRHEQMDEKEIRRLEKIIYRHRGKRQRPCLQHVLIQSNLDTRHFNKQNVLLCYIRIVHESYYRASIPLEVIKQFIELGSNINDRDDCGRTILHWVAEKGVITTEYFVEFGNRSEKDVVSKLELLNYLVEKGADVTLTDVNGNDPFKLLLLSDQPDVIIDRFLDIIGGYNFSDPRRHGMVTMSPSQLLNRRNKDGLTCLHQILVRNYGADIIKKMIAFGADPNVAVESMSGISALQHALTHRYDFNIPLLTILIPTNVELITANNNQANSSSKILNLVIIRDFSKIDSKIFEDFLDKLITAGFAIDKDFLSRAIRSFLRFELVEVLMRKNVPITVHNIVQAIQFQRFDVALLLLDTIYETDKEKVREIRTNHPGLLCESVFPVVYICSLESIDVTLIDVTLIDVMKVLLEKFEIDVNYSDDHNFILHNLVRRNEVAILEYLVTNHPDLDINKKVDSVSALEFALNYDSFDFAAMLIHNFSSTADLHSITPTKVGFTKCYQLLYQLGVDIEFEGVMSRAVQREVEWFNGWIDRQKVKVNSLTKLCTLAIRKNVSSRSEVEEITQNFVLPDKVVEMLNLADEQESYIPNPNDKNYFSDSDDYHWLDSD